MCLSSVFKSKIKDDHTQTAMVPSAHSVFLYLYLASYLCLYLYLCLCLYITSCPLTLSHRLQLCHQHTLVGLALVPLSVATVIIGYYLIMRYHWILSYYRISLDIIVLSDKIGYYRIIGYPWILLMRSSPPCLPPQPEAS